MFVKSRNKQITCASKSKESNHANKIFIVKSLVGDETQHCSDQCEKWLKIESVELVMMTTCLMYTI